MRASAAPARLRYEPLPLQVLVQGLGRGQRPIGMLRPEVSQKLGGTPPGPLPSELDGRLEDVVGMTRR